MIKSLDALLTNVFGGYINQNSDDVKVPNLLGLTLEEARVKLIELGFLDVTVRYEYDKNVAKNNVIGIEGAVMGEFATEMTPIVLVVSMGKNSN